LSFFFHCSCSHPSFLLFHQTAGKLLIVRFLKHLGFAAFPFIPPYSHTITLQVFLSNELLLVVILVLSYLLVSLVPYWHTGP
jgi:hypothetical protein